MQFVLRVSSYTHSRSCCDINGRKFWTQLLEVKTEYDFTLFSCQDSLAEAADDSIGIFCVTRAPDGLQI